MTAYTYAGEIIVVVRDVKSASDVAGALLLRIRRGSGEEKIVPRDQVLDANGNPPPDPPINASL